MSQSSSPIYLDHNASTPVLPEVFDAMIPWLRDHYGNPSSTHCYGRNAHAALERAREQVSGLIDCNSEELYFTSGGTEANNLAIRGLAAANPGRLQIVTSVIEHPAVLEPCAHLADRGYSIMHAPVDGSGRVLEERVKDMLSRQTLLLTIMHANSETGTLQAIANLSELGHQQGALVHSDAAQSVGKVPVSVAHAKLDLLSIAGHKLYAPKGVGALYVKSGTPIQPVLRGAGHERGLRPGTENIAFIVGLGQACIIAKRDLHKEGLRLERLRDRFWSLLQEKIPGIGLNGDGAERLPNTLNVRFPSVSGNKLLDLCPNIAASTGSACHESGESASAVILAMGIPEQKAIGSVRLTLGRANTNEDIDAAAGDLTKAWKFLSRSNLVS